MDEDGGSSSTVVRIIDCSVIPLVVFRLFGTPDILVVVALSLLLLLLVQCIFQKWENIIVSTRRCLKVIVVISGIWIATIFFFRTLRIVSCRLI